jgi:hypothetical protein
MVTLGARGRLGPMIAKPVPVTIDVKRDRSVTLTWADGTTSGFGLEELRQRCPCAECRTRGGIGPCPYGRWVLRRTVADR